MRVLWFSTSPVTFKGMGNGEPGKNWISSLMRVVSKIEDFELGIAYVYDSLEKKAVETQGNVSLFPMGVHRTRIELWHDAITYKDIDRLVIDASMKVVDSYHPDIIQVFGSEWCFGLIAECSSIPVVIHMQGFWPENRIAGPVSEGLHWSDFIKSPKRSLFRYYFQRLSMERSQREEHIMRTNRYFMGRTRWDKAIVKLYNPSACYFTVNEAIREEFVNADPWQPSERNGLRLISVGSGWLKGIDVMLRAAKLLKENSSLPFSWEVYGSIPDSKTLKKLTGVYPEEVNVRFMGNADAATLVRALQQSTIYIHTTYADNSPNSICEAQYLGLPVITTNAGGIVSLLPEDYDRDLILPINDPYYTAEKILELSSDHTRMVRLGTMNRSFAKARQSDENIRKELMDAYNIICQSAK